MNRSLTYISRGLAAALLIMVLAACGVPGAANEPTPIQPTTAAPAVTPTAGAARPTAATTPTTGTAPTPNEAHPTQTAAPVARPIIGFNPKAGNPGTVVSIFGSGYAPGAPVKVRLGLPTPTGEVLASAFADDKGRWNASLAIPDRLPSGEPIEDGEFYLVAMNDQNIALASAPFDFVPTPLPAPTHDGAVRIVREMLDNFGSGDVTRYLAKNLRDEAAAGRPVHQLLGLAPLAWQRYVMHGVLDRPSEVLFVGVRLEYPTFSEERIFTLVVEGYEWRITGSSPRDPAPQPAPTAVDAVGAFLGLAQNDRSMQNARFYLGGRLRELVYSGQINDVDTILEAQTPFQMFIIDQVLGSDADNTYIQATLFSDTAGRFGTAYIFTVSNREDGTWRIFKVTFADDIDSPLNQGWPGPEWQVAGKSDYNGDGIEETIFVRPSSVQPRAWFDDDLLNRNARVVSAAMVAQGGAHGPWVMLEIDGLKIQAAETLLRSFAGGVPGPVAFQLALDPGNSTLIHLLPLNGDGTRHSQLIGINWDQAAHGYRLAPQP